MRVPKREDQSLFISPLIVRQLSSQSIILDQVQLSYEYYTRSVGFVNPFYKFFQNGGGGNRTLVFVGSDMRLSPNRLPNTPPKNQSTKLSRTQITSWMLIQSSSTKSSSCGQLSPVRPHAPMRSARTYAALLPVAGKRKENII